MTAAQEQPVLCPNTRQHHEQGEAYSKQEPWYKTERRAWAYRLGFEASQRACDWCNPRCPTCCRRSQREHAPWLLAAQDGGQADG